MEKSTLFGQLNAYFDHVYVVTIARAAYRHPALAEELHGLEYEWYYGADAKAFRTEDLVQSGLYDDRLARKNHRYDKSITGGMLGCSWSHRMVYEDILARGYQNALILEDDVRLRPEAFAPFLAALKELPGDWEMLWLDYKKNEYRPRFGPIKQAWYHLVHAVGALQFSHRMISHLYAMPYSPNLLTAGFHDYSDAYAITHAGAAKLLKMQTPIQWLADNLLATASTDGTLRSFCLREKLFYQTSQTTQREDSLINKPGD